MQVQPEKGHYSQGLISVDKGILTGCDERQEWLLIWWWKNLTKFNAYPITFCDFGMSPSARAWCASKGNVITQSKEMFPIKNINEQVANPPWKDTITPRMWDHRPIWFYKPLVLPKTPYKRTLWMDPDCEVKGSIEPLMDLPLGKDRFAIRKTSEEDNEGARKMGYLSPGVSGVQAGVILYEKDTPVIPAWIDRFLHNHPNEFSDEHCLDHLLHDHPFEITHFSPLYNSTEFNPPNPNAIIHHHSSAKQKRILLQKIHI
ncbi:MAG: hypothetical protein KDK76_02645 [Chlamydiia bacterium]|nr:hypothetical protein [Chlamydiia bacterium]